jgi:hypothetical protein
MKIYWTIKSIPELSNLPDEERKTIWRRCWAKASRKTWIELCILSVFVGFCMALGIRIWGHWVGIFITTIAGFVLGFIWVQLVIRKTIPYIRAEVNSGRQTNDEHNKQ